jgi:short-subunit dehydrogenase
MDYQGKTVLITGASSGIGEALAKLYAQRGANLILIARRLDRLEKLLTTLPSGSAKHCACRADVSIDGELENAVTQALSTLPGIDIVIAGSGFGVVGRAENLSLEEYRRQFETNVFGVLRTLHATLPALKKSRGRFAVIGSVNSYLSLPGNSPYGMSKYAVRALTDSLYHELYPYGIGVTHLSPGFVATEIRKVDNQGKYRAGSVDPVPPWLAMPPEKAAKIIFRAVERRARERAVTVHGWLVVLMARHFPATTAFLLRSLGVSARKPLN